MRRPKPLIVLGGLGRTFGSLICFLAALFLAGGAYILEDAVAHPMDAQAAGVIFAACVIALAALLLFYLFKPRKRDEPSNLHYTSNSASPMRQPVLRATSAAGRKDDSRKDLAYQRIYVDHSRIQR